MRAFHLLKLLILTHKWTVRLIVGCSVAAFFIVASLILIMRYWFLPNIQNYRGQIENTVSRALGEKVAIGSIKADWKGVHPHLILRDVRIFDKSGQAALTLERIENSLSWMTFLTGEVRFSSLEIDNPRLGIRRDKTGTIYVAGIPVNQGPASSGMSDWLLHQSRIWIKNGFVLWEDEARDAPPLMLEQVNFALINVRQHHLFGLQAVPPADLSSPLDIRANLFGSSLNNLRAWRGKFYARIDYADTSKLRKWLPAPEQLLGGRGGMRVWLDFSDEKPETINADLALSDVSARLGKALPPIGMKTLQGRIGWAGLNGGYEIWTKRLSLVTESGESVAPTDFLLKSVTAHDGDAGEGEVSANFVDLGMISTLSEHFPMTDTLRKALAEYSPKGKLEDLQVKWRGDEPESGLFSWFNHPAKKNAGKLPAHYSVKTRFDNLGLSFSGNVFKRISGHIDGNENGGSLSLDARHPEFSLPKVFELPVRLDTLTAQTKWQSGKNGYSLSFDNISFSNEHLAGNAFGSYDNGTRFADFTGRLTRVDASQVWRYLPLVVGQDARNWVKSAILKGESDDIKIRLKGKLDDFPFDNHNGLFQTTLRVKNASLRYAPGWPEIDSLSADIAFQGSRMEITSRQGTILGVKLNACKAVIPDLGHAVLAVEGDASGPTDEFLTFIDQSPVTGFINGFTEGLHATGGGSLKLKLDIPLEKVTDTKVSGSYSFLGDNIAGSGIPDVSRLSGRLDFSESTVNAKNISAVILGGAATINAATQQDGSLKVAVSGKIDPDNIPAALARHFHGSTGWQGTISVHKKNTDILIASSLQGLSSDLPPPFSKQSSEIIPLRFESRSVSQNEDNMTLSYGKILTASVIGGTENGFRRIDHGAVYLGESPPETLPDTPGIWLIGSLESFDADKWHDIFEDSSGGTSPVSLAGIDLDISSLTFLGKNFGKLALSATQHEGNWQAEVSGDDVNGSIEWLPEGKGRLIAKLKGLTIPFTPPEKEAPESKAVLKKVANRDLPALDITADSFTLKNRKVGRLELVAVQQGNDWKIQKLRVANPDSVLTADGLWQGWAIHPRTNINIKLDVLKIGKFLSRFGYPSNLMRGSGKMEGTLSWAGSPQSVNYATLSGNIVMTAKHGQFNKIDPGIGKLLGILSLQDLPRRITLDFRDIFSQGFAFDDISSSLKITDGVARTDNLKIVGPAAEVDMSGSVDLDRETQDLKIIVKPQLGGSVSVASSLLGGPVVGIATWVVGKVLQDPLDQLASYEYNVTGSWTDPVVKKAHEK